VGKKRGEGEESTCELKSKKRKNRGERQSDGPYKKRGKVVFKINHPRRTFQTEGARGIRHKKRGGIEKGELRRISYSGQGLVKVVLKGRVQKTNEAGRRKRKDHKDPGLKSRIKKKKKR